jgi:hypothetical protein
VPARYPDFGGFNRRADVKHGYEAFGQSEPTNVFATTKSIVRSQAMAVGRRESAQRAECGPSGGADVRHLVFGS